MKVLIEAKNRFGHGSEKGFMKKAKAIEVSLPKKEKRPIISKGVAVGALAALPLTVASSAAANKVQKLYFTKYSSALGNVFKKHGGEAFGHGVAADLFHHGRKKTLKSIGPSTLAKLPAASKTILGNAAKAATRTKTIQKIVSTPFRILASRGGIVPTVARGAVLGGLGLAVYKGLKRKK